MPDTDTITTEPLHPLMSSPFEFDLRTAARLGARAEGVEIVTVDAPAGLAGVPAKIPVALRRGDRPEVTGIESLFEGFRIHPQAKTGTAQLQTFEAFCALLNRHQTPDSAVFADADWKKPSFTAVIDYHRLHGGDADNLKHRLHYAFPLSEEWQAWTKMDQEPMDQQKFAWFLEDRVAELASPTDHEKVTLEHQFQTTIATPAKVVELSRGLAVNIDSQVKATTTLQTGEGQIAWAEVHKDADGKPLKVPGIFMLSIAPFFMGEKVRIPVRLRYRPSGSKIIWFYQMYRPDIAITEHVRERLAQVRAETGLPTYEGAPEA